LVAAVGGIPQQSLQSEHHQKLEKMRFGGSRWAVFELIQYLVALSIGDLDKVLSEPAPAAAIQRQNAGDELDLCFSHFFRLQHAIDVLRNVGVDRAGILVARDDALASSGEDREFRLGERSVRRGGRRGVGGGGARCGSGISLASGANKHRAATEKREAVNEDASRKTVRPAARARHGA